MLCDELEFIVSYTPNRYSNEFNVINLYLVSDVTTSATIHNENIESNETLKRKLDTTNKTNIANRIRRSASQRCGTSPCTCESDQILDLQYSVWYESVTLFAYFPLHGKSQTSDIGTGTNAKEDWCSHLNTIEGLLPYLAFRYAIDRVNEDTNVLPNLKMGYLAFDTCGDVNHARVLFEAFTQKRRLFTQYPQQPVMTYLYGFLGEVGDDVTAALDDANTELPKLLQVIHKDDTSSVSQYRIHRFKYVVN